MEQRQNELRLLDEYVKAGKVTYLSEYKPEELKLTVEEEDELEGRMLEGKKEHGREHLGDGNFRLGSRPKEKD